MARGKRGENKCLSKHYGQTEGKKKSRANIYKYAWAAVLR